MRQRLPRIQSMTVLTALAGLMVGGLASQPVKVWYLQRQQLNELRLQVQAVQDEVVALEQKLQLLQTDAEIERRARRDFHLVYPGQESYRILPAPQDGPVGK